MNILTLITTYLPLISGGLSQVAGLLPTTYTTPTAKITVNKSKYLVSVTFVKVV
jgi:hypothetical protein